MAEVSSSISFLYPPTTTVSATSIASFLYGNGVPCSLALQLVKLCNEEADDALLHQIYSLCPAWASSSSSFNLTIFWDMRRKTYMLLNGPYGPHTVVESPVAGSVTDHVYGFGAKPRSLIMRRKLYYLRNNAHVF